MATAEDNPVLAAAGVDEVPTPKATKLQAIQEQLQASSQRTAATIEQTKEAVLETERATGILTDAFASATAATKIISATKSAAELTAQNSTIAAFNATGGSKLQTSLLTTQGKLITRSQELQAEKLDILDDEHTGIGVIDNIVNQFRHQSISAELNVTDKAIDRTNSQLSAIAQSTTQVAQTNALTKKTMNEATIAADLKLIEAEGKVKGAEADLRALSSNAKALSSLAQADAQHSANLREAYNLEGNAEDRQVRRVQFAKLREKWVKDDIAEADKKSLEVTLSTAVQRGQAAAGVAVSTPQEALWGLTQTGAQGAKYDKYLELGSEAQPVLGNTPATARDTLAVVSPTGAYKKTKGSDLLKTISMKQQEGYAVLGAVRPKTVESEALDFNTTANQVLAVASSNIAAGDSSNPYAAPPMETLAEFATVKNSALYQKVLSGTQLVEADPVTVTREAIASVESGLITAEQAVDGINTLYQAGADYNNTIDGGFKRYGLPNQTSYITTLDQTSNSLFDFGGSTLELGLKATIGAIAPLSGLLGTFQGSDKVRVDLLDRAATMEYFIKELSNIRSEGSVSSTDTSTDTPKGDK